MYRKKPGLDGLLCQLMVLKTLMQRARAGIVQPFISEVSFVQEGSLL